MELSSQAFKPGDLIPVKYTCDGEDISIPLTWSKPRSQPKSFVVIMDDPDAPMGTFTHWVLYNIPPTITSLPEGIPKQKETPQGLQGINDFGEVGYGGPCPPRTHQPHRYFIRLYALDAVLDLKGGARVDDVKTAMNNHIIETAELMGRYGRKK